MKKIALVFFLIAGGLVSGCTPNLSFETFVKVIWVTEDHLNDRYEIGVEFLEMPKGIAQRLLNYINYIKNTLERRNNPPGKADGGGHSPIA